MVHSLSHKQRQTNTNIITGTQFSYLDELFPTHLRVKDVCLGVAMISLMNIVWLQSAPTPFLKVGWKFYLAFIIPGTIGAIVMIICFPDTKGLPLEEVATLFGDYHADGLVGEKMETTHLEGDRKETRI